MAWKINKHNGATNNSEERLTINKIIKIITLHEMEICCIMYNDKMIPAAFVEKQKSITE